MFPVGHASLYLGNAGTAFRPLTAVLALARGHYELAGQPRMHERPIGDLVDALRALGADIRYLAQEGFPPLAIGPGPASVAAAPDRVTVRGDVSSQFLSALLMALPMLTARSEHGINVDIELLQRINRTISPASRSFSGAMRLIVRLIRCRRSSGKRGCPCGRSRCW